jgi:hypothetical protein
MKTLPQLFLILSLVGFFILGNASAQIMGPFIAQSNNQGSFQNQNTSDSQILKTSMPQKDLARRLLDNTTLNYYQQFLGPTAGGAGNMTYNVFQEGLDSPGTGFAPYQSFHAINLRHQINTDWALGATLTAVNGYTTAVKNQDLKGNYFSNAPETQFFNARGYLNLPPLKMAYGSLFTTLSYEHPTSSISKEDEMRWGWVATQSFAFNLPDVRWNAGIMGQVYRLYYKNNTKAPPFSPELGGRPTPLQTMIVSGGPYVNYRFSDLWMASSTVTFDWDQRGQQTGSTQFNNNLSNRGRMTITYFPQKINYLQSIGIFSQALLKFSPETTAFGADFAVRF